MITQPQTILRPTFFFFLKKNKNLLYMNEIYMARQVDPH